MNKKNESAVRQMRARASKRRKDQTELICAVTEELSVVKVMTTNHEEELASLRMYSVALLAKYQKKLDEKNNIIAKQQKHSRRIHVLIAKQQKELYEKNELIRAIRKRLCPQPPVREEFSTSDMQSKQERKGVTFRVQTEQLIDGTQVCHEYGKYDELDYDPGLTEFIAYIQLYD